MTIVHARAGRHISAEELEFGPSDAECPVCGGLDNHASRRRGLCCWCYCSLANAVGDEAVQRMPADELVRKAKAARLAAIRKGTAPRIGKPPKVQTQYKPSASAQERKRAYMKEYRKRRKAEELQDAAKAEARQRREREWRRAYYQRHKAEIAARNASLTEEERAIKRAYDKMWHAKQKQRSKNGEIDQNRQS